jgi:hypothetical protein
VGLFISIAITIAIFSVVGVFVRFEFHIINYYIDAFECTFFIEAVDKLDIAFVGVLGAANIQTQIGNAVDEVGVRYGPHRR